MKAEIVNAFHSAAKLRRSDIFADERLTPLTAVDDAHTAAPGWVGSRWSRGTLMVGINPGGGGDNYRRNPTDDELYSALRSFRDAGTLEDRTRRFADVSRRWIEIQRTHNIWRVISAILDATGEAAEDVAFMNILPFRTRGDAPAPSSVLNAAWHASAEPQIRALQPKRIVALGKKSWTRLAKHNLPYDSELILMKRAIGDSYIPPESLLVLEQLRRQIT